MNEGTAGALGADADQAAGLLMAVGRLVPAPAGEPGIDAGVPLRCLLAAEGLLAAGAAPANVTPLTYDPTAAAEAIRTAVDLLAQLPPGTFTSDLIADAAADARAALAALG